MMRSAEEHKIRTMHKSASPLHAQMQWQCITSVDTSRPEARVVAQRLGHLQDLISELPGGTQDQGSGPPGLGLLPVLLLLP